MRGISLSRFVRSHAPLFVVLFLWSCGGSGGGGGANGSAETYPITLAWDAPSQNEDGTELTDLAGFVIYDGPSPGSYTMETDVGNTTTHTLELPAGTYYFAVTAYDMDGFESDFSGEISETVPLQE